MTTQDRIIEMMEKRPAVCTHGERNINDAVTLAAELLVRAEAAEARVAVLERGKKEQESSNAALGSCRFELAHLVRLMEPVEKDGGFNIPGLATLNGARAALADAKQVARYESDVAEQAIQTMGLYREALIEIKRVGDGPAYNIAFGALKG